MATQTLLTGEQFDQLPVEEGLRYELLEGELLEVSSATFGHNEIITALLLALMPFLRANRLGTAVPDTEFGFGARTRLRPDVAVVLQEKLGQLDRWRVPVPVPPDIAIEVISPSESANDVERKLNVYLKTGVSEVWVIYQERIVYVYRSMQDVRRLQESDTLDSPLLPGWSMPVAELFE